MTGISVSEWRHGWKVVFGAAMGMGTGYGLLMMCSGLFLKPMQEDFGWSRAALSFLPVISVISAVMLPLTGYLLDRFGARRIGIAGLLALIVGYLLMASVPPKQFIFYAVVVFIGVIVSATGGISWTRGVATWFFKNRGAAFGISMCGTSIISAIVMPLLNEVIEASGWRSGFIMLAGISVIFGLPPAVLFFRERATVDRYEQPMEQGDDKAGFLPALKNLRFWLLFTTFGLVSIPLGGFMIHLVPILTDKGVDTATAAMAAAAFALAIAFGRVAAGFLLDRLWPPAVASFCFMVPIIGVILMDGLQPGSGSMGLIAAVSGMMIGLAQGAEADFIAFFTARYFPLEVYARVFSLIAMGTYGMISLGGMLFAVLHDIYGNHDLSMSAAMGCYFLAGVIILGADRMRPGKSKT